MNCDDVKTLISAYADGELSQDAAGRVAAHLDQCALCRAAVEDFTRLSREIRTAGRPAASAELKQRISAALAEERQSSAVVPVTPRSSGRRAAPLRRYIPDWRQLAAVLTLCIASSAATFVATERHEQTARADGDLVAAHTRALLQDNPVQVVSSDSHTVRPWFAGRVDFAPNVKDLAQQGFALVGGRLDLVAGQRVAVAVYKHGMHWINVYMWPASAALPTSQGEATRKGYNLLTWTRDGVVYSSVSDASRTEMREFERLMQ